MIESIKKNLTDAMREKDKPRMITLRNILGMIKLKEIEKGEALGENEVTSVLMTMAKQLRDSIEQYRNGGREDLANNESFELDIIKGYLPEQMSEDKIRMFVKEIISSSGASELSDIGKIMGSVMAKLQGKADGKVVNQIVREELS